MCGDSASQPIVPVTLVAGLHFGLAYVLTDSLAFPIALHFATNFWVVSVFGQPDSAFPALLRVERDLQADPTGITIGLLPTVVLVGLILGRVSVTRGDLSVPTTLSHPPRDVPDEATGD